MTSAFELAAVKLVGTHIDPCACPVCAALREQMSEKGSDKHG